MDKMQQRDLYIVVGQGIAGTILTHFLRKRGVSVLVFDRGLTGTSTSIAAGLINPVTGRRYVKSWRIDQLLPFARSVYGELEDLLGIELYRERRILRALRTIREQNDWLARCADPAYQPYLLDQAELGNYRHTIALVDGYGEVQGGAQVDVRRLIKAYRSLLLAEGCLREEEFQHGALRSGPLISYGAIKAKGIIFCEGHRAMENPFFNYLPFHGDKGEVLIVKMEKAGYRKCLKDGIFITPLGEDLYWIGATYERRYENEEPSAEGKAYIAKALRELVRIPFEIVRHEAAVRPTVRDRRPFLGVHPQWPGLYLFNGMGTKGTSLTPFWADRFCDFLLEDKPLDPEVNISRFAHYRIAQK